MSSRHDVVVPAGLAEDVPELFGARGARWLAELPELVGVLCREWDLTVVGAGLTGGTHSYVAPVRSAHRSRDTLVLKVPVLDDENYAEAAALRCYAGDGAVRLHRVDLGSGALLLERAEPGHSLLDDHLTGKISAARAIRTAADLLGRLSREPSGDLSCPRPGTSADGEPAVPVRPDGAAQPFPLARELAEHWSIELVRIHERFGRPYEHGLFTEAAGLAAELAGTAAPEVIVNRDAHLGNILAAPPERGGWLLIDPKPLLGPAAFDAGHLIWDLLRLRPTVPQARLLIAEVAAGLAVDPAEIRAWGMIRVLSNVSWAHPEGAAQRYIEVASALAGAR